MATGSMISSLFADTCWLCFHFVPRLHARRDWQFFMGEIVDTIGECQSQAHPVSVSSVAYATWLLRFPDLVIDELCIYIEEHKCSLRGIIVASTVETPYPLITKDAIVPV